MFSVLFCAGTQTLHGACSHFRHAGEQSTERRAASSAAAAVSSARLTLHVQRAAVLPRLVSAMATPSQL